MHPEISLARNGDSRYSQNSRKMSTQTATASESSIVVMIAGDENAVHIGADRTLSAVAHARYLSKFTRANPDLERRLLIPYFERVPFQEAARAAELDFLGAWLAAPERVSVRTLIGPAGSGKTRLAIEFFNRQSAARPDWKFGWLHVAELRRFAILTNLDKCSWPNDICVVVDYASECAGALRRLFEQSLTAENGEPGPKLRLLLLDRVGGGWYTEDLRSKFSSQKDAIDALFAANPADPHPLPRFGLEARPAILGTAVRIFSEPRPAPAIPAEGADATFDLRLADKAQPWGEPLFLIIAAAATAELGLGQALALSRTELARFAAHKEWSRISRIADAARASDRETPLHRMTALITFAGGATRTDASAAALRERQRLGWTIGAQDLIADVDRVLIAGEDGLWKGMQPDVVGEAYLLEYLAGPDRKLGDDGQVDLLHAAMAIDFGGAAQTLVKTLQNFALGAGAQGVADTGTTPSPEFQRRLREQELLLRLIRAFMESCGAEDIEALWALHAAIPVRSTLLREFNLELLDRIEQIAVIEDRFTALRLVNSKSIVLASLGRQQDALVYGRQLVDILKPLAAAQPDAFLSHLASSLNNLSTMLSGVGDRNAALAAILEAVDIRRRLAAAQSAAFLLDLATSLLNLANALNGVGDQKAALAAIREAVDTYRQLAVAQPDAFLPYLATSINNLAKILSDVGDRNAALAAIREAVDTYRQLAAVQPDAFLPDLATSLNNLAGMLSEVGDRNAGLAAIREAVQICRQLATAQPDAFLSGLAISLNSLANVLSDVGDRNAALIAIREAVDIYRHLALAHPTAQTDALLPNLAISLNTLAKMLSNVGDRSAALTAVRETLDIYRRLAAAQRNAFLPDLAMSLNNLATMLINVDDCKAALAAIHEAVDIRRQLAAAQPDAFLPDLAMSLSNMAGMLSDVVDRKAALAAIQEAVDIRRQLAAAQPDAFLPDFVTSLNNLAKILNDAGDRSAALAVIRETVDTYRQLAAAQPDAFLPNLATSLALGARILLSADNWEQAAGQAAESVALVLPFLQYEPDRFVPMIAANIETWREASRKLGHDVPDDIQAAFEQLLASRSHNNS